MTYTVSSGTLNPTQHELGYYLFKKFTIVYSEQNSLKQA